MKAWIALLTLLYSGTTFAHSNDSADHPAVHGMAVVGSEQIYLSHLPMFHSPHDYQVLLEVAFDVATRKIYERNKAESDETVYTIAPSVFVLPAMAKEGNSFSARLYKGHFERGGMLLHPKAKVTIKRVLLFKKFQRGTPRPREARFVLFGNQKEQFMAHLISAKPDFDQILSVEVNDTLTKKLSVSGLAMELILPDLNNDMPVPAPVNVRATLPNSSEFLELKALLSLYLETGDLSF